MATDSEGYAEVMLYSTGDIPSNVRGGVLTIKSERYGESKVPFSISAYDNSQRVMFIEQSSIGNNTLSINNGGKTNSNQSTSVVFIAKDENGNPIENIKVDFSLSDDSLGVTLSKDSAVTDSTGLALINLFTGSEPGQVYVNAVTTKPDGQTVTGSSDYINIGENISEVGYLEYNGSESAFIYLNGVSNTTRPASTTVNYTIKDNDGNPLEGVKVDFEVIDSLNDATINKNFAISDTDGNVEVILTAGIPNNSIYVEAIVKDEFGDITMSSRSDPIKVTTGLPDATSISLAVSQRGVEIDNVPTVTIQAALADRYGNPVPDGTTVRFTTESGIIDPSCTTVKSRCDVEWTTKAPFPSDGRASIMAYVVGHESYADDGVGTGNGFYDVGESYIESDDAFRDDDENGRYDNKATEGNNFDFAEKEIYIDYGSDGRYSNANGQFDEGTHAYANTVLSLTYSNDSLFKVYKVPAGTPSCVLSDGTLRSSCQLVSGNFSESFNTGVDKQYFIAVVATDRGACFDSSGEREDTINPNSSTCDYVYRNTIPTASTITIQSDFELNGDVSAEIPTNRSGALEMLFNITSENGNDEPNIGEIKVTATLPTGRDESLNFEAVDPADPE